MSWGSGSVAAKVIVKSSVWCPAKRANDHARWATRWEKEFPRSFCHAQRDRPAHAGAKVKLALELKLVADHVWLGELRRFASAGFGCEDPGRRGADRDLRRKVQELGKVSTKHPAPHTPRCGQHDRVADRQLGKNHGLVFQVPGIHRGKAGFGITGQNGPLEGSPGSASLQPRQ